MTKKDIKNEIDLKKDFDLFIERNEILGYNSIVKVEDKRIFYEVFLNHILFECDLIKSQEIEKCHASELDFLENLKEKGSGFDIFGNSDVVIKDRIAWLKKEVDKK